MIDGMYGARASYYDLIYHWKDYGAESTALHTLLRGEGIQDGATLLEAGCGTGSHLTHMRAWYHVAGFDLSPEMIAVARRKLPGVELFAADMSSFERGGQAPLEADVLLCLFGAIAYLHPIERLEKAAECFARAVRRGGVLIVEPFVSPESFVPGRVHMQTYDSDELKLCRMSTSRVRGDIAELTMHWLALGRDGTVDRFTEEHALILLSSAALVDVFNRAGFDASFEPHGLMEDRGLLIGRRR
jgi:daunosaminyl-N,N-dimethyltransferase/N-dimethyltransferase